MFDAGSRRLLSAGADPSGSGSAAARALLASLGLLCLAEVVLADGPAGPAAPGFPGIPAFRTGRPKPTMDKPQSKLWYARGSWWAWLPTAGGSAVWRRTAQGWRRQRSLDDWLRGLPGRGDVWAEGDRVRAALLDEDQIAFAGLRFDPRRASYLPDGPPRMLPLLPGRGGAKPVETVTLARDDLGRWWIAHDHANRVRVRASLDEGGERWTEAMAISGELHPDDLCAVASLGGSVGVLWSDQRRGGMYFRLHFDSKAPEEWERVETAAEGPRLADDHINLAVASDGTLYAATKNSVDRVGEPQLCLYVRRPGGAWESYPYAKRTDAWEPSRPVVQISQECSRILLAHTLYDRRRPREYFHPIALLDCDARDIALDRPGEVVIGAFADLNDATASKAALPPAAPWVLLASDGGGNVYEAVLPRRTRL